jgi:uncharacterized protein (DUF305 family)
MLLRANFQIHACAKSCVATIQLSPLNDGETKKMAQEIIDDQEKEVADMQAWLKKNGH